MSDKFPQLPFKKVRRVLEHLGCIFRQKPKGSHYRFYYKSRAATIEDKGKTEIPEGMVRGALRDVRISRKEYIQAYKEVFKKK